MERDECHRTFAPQGMRPSHNGNFEHMGMSGKFCVCSQRIPVLSASLHRKPRSIAKLDAFCRQALNLVWYCTTFTAHLSSRYDDVLAPVHYRDHPVRVPDSQVASSESASSERFRCRFRIVEILTTRGIRIEKRALNSTSFMTMFPVVTTSPTVFPSLGTSTSLSRCSSSILTTLTPCAVAKAWPCLAINFDLWSGDSDDQDG